MRIPDSTKAFSNYLNGAPHRHLINDTQTMVCSAREFVKFYQHAIPSHPKQGCFDTPQARRQFERIMTTASPIPLVIPEHTLCYMKGGEADFAGQHAMATTGMLCANGSRVAFALLYNWDGQGNFEAGQANYIAACRAVFEAIRDLTYIN